MDNIDQIPYHELMHQDAQAVWDSEEHHDIEQVTIAYEHGQWWAIGWNQEDEQVTFCLAETNRGYEFEEV